MEGRRWQGQIKIGIVETKRNNYPRLEREDPEDPEDPENLEGSTTPMARNLIKQTV